MSCSTAKASISGSSVVPGLPNITLTPSCLSKSRKARFPDITGKFLSPGHSGSRAVARETEIHNHNIRSFANRRLCRAGWRIPGSPSRSSRQLPPAFALRATARQPSLAARAKAGAAEGIRTPDPRITNAVLYRLSYRGMPTEWRRSNTRGLLTQDSLPANGRGVIESPGRGAYAAANTKELNRVGGFLRHARSG